MLAQWNAEEYTMQCGSNRDMADIKLDFHARWCIHESLCHFWHTVGKSYKLERSSRNICDWKGITVCYIIFAISRVSLKKWKERKTQCDMFPCLIFERY
jgi:hypothetical protein